MLGSVCFAQITKPSSDNMIVVGNGSQAVQWLHRADIQASILAAGPQGVVWIPPTYEGTDCNPISSCNPGSVLVIDLRGGMFQTYPGIAGGSLLNTVNTWQAIQYYNADIHMLPAGGPNFYFNRQISTSANAPQNGCSFCFGPSDPMVYGCVSCDPTESFSGFTSVNGVFTMNIAKGGGSSTPTQLCDYLGCKLGYNKRTGAQSIGSTIAGNSDLVGELSFSGATTATYTWVNAPGTPGAYTTHPECDLQPQFDYSTNRFWATYTGTTSFTINFSGAVTGAVTYTCIYRN